MAKLRSWSILGRKKIESVLLCMKSDVKGELKDNSGAIADFTKAIEINPNYANAYNNRGISKHSTGLDGCSDLMKAKSLGFNVHPGAMEAICN